MPSSATSTQSEHSAIESLQSLVVAFVLAMTFRGFVTEGFVIPTGSMAPTLLGQHKRLHSDQTGIDFSVGIDPRRPDAAVDTASDPMLGPRFPGSGTSTRQARTRMGDRILVLKSLYRFFEPNRFDVVVFKNPTNPNGEDGNYIKRLIGLPDEALWLVDGDVFAGSADDPDAYERYSIQRKPEHVQRAVWQPVFDSGYFPRAPLRLDVPYSGVPWAEGPGFEVGLRPSYRSETADETEIVWDIRRRYIDDWTPYNMLVHRIAAPQLVAVSDIRVAGTVVPDEDGLSMRFEIETRGHLFQFALEGDRAEVRLRPLDYGEDFPDEGWEGTIATIDPLPAGRPTQLEFWHVDQSMALYVDGRRVAQYDYDWSPLERLRSAAGRPDAPLDEVVALPPGPPTIRWRFGGSPVTLHSVQLDRDLHYRMDRLNDHARKNPTSPGFEPVVASRRWASATHPDHIAVLGPDHFFMAGDNSSASSDSRLWGNPHPLVATQIDRSPFFVHRKLLLGKAWVVYFPAPYPVIENGRAFIPDFGGLRFIR